MKSLESQARDLVEERFLMLGFFAFAATPDLGGLYFAKTYSAKSKSQYRNVVNRTLPNQESDKPESTKTYSGI